MIINDVQFNCSLEDVLTELVNQLRANNIPLILKQRNSGEHIMITCPYHSNGIERKPSAGIRKSDGLLHCFACGEVHSLPEVISHCFGHTDDLVGKWGWQWLLRNFATVQVEERKDVDLDFSRNIGGRVFNSFSAAGKHKNQIGRVDKLDKTYVSEEELDKYRYTHPYILKRGISEEVINLFDIGWDSRTNCITFPNLDKYGNCLFVARRSVKQKFFQYPPHVQKEVYGIYQLYKLHVFPSEVIVCESMIDALSFWTVGKYAVALNGTGNDTQFKQLRELPCREIILATDMDEAGLRARERIRKNMRNTKIISEYFFPEGRKDANDCTKEELIRLEKVF